MPTGYKYLSQEQRYKIEIMYRNKVSLRSIAANIGISPLTLSRELRRNKGDRGYRGKQAQSKYQERNSRQGKALKFKGELLYCRGADTFRFASRTDFIRSFTHCSSRQS